MYKESLSEKLRYARNKTGLKQEEIANELKIARSTLANYETGRTEPDIETLGKLIDYYEIEARWILGTKK